MPRLDSCLYFKPKAVFEITCFFLTTTWCYYKIRANWTWISDCLESSILKTVPVSQDSKEMLNTSLENLSTTNYTKPLFRIAWHFWTNTKYSGEVSLIISMDIFIGSWLSVRELYLIVKHIKISLYAQTQQSLLLLTQGNLYNHLRFVNKYLVF